VSDFLKDPSDEIDFTRTWGDWLADGETISTVVWTVEAGLTKMTSPAESNTTTTATVWLEGGTVDEEYDVACRITTNQSRVVERTFTVKVQNL
jgi:hypothetical protein